MEKLPVTYEHCGMTMQQLWRDDNVAVYGSENYYEVFKIRIQKHEERIVKGVLRIFKEKELLPANEGFGFYAFCPNTEKKAFMYRDVLLKRVGRQKA